MGVVHINCQPQGAPIVSEKLFLSAYFSGLIPLKVSELNNPSGTELRILTTER